MRNIGQAASTEVTPPIGGDGGGNSFGEDGGGIGATYKIGTLTRTHGVKGELAFSFTDDVWDRVEADYLFLKVDGILVPFFLEEWRFRNDTVALLKFQDIDDADKASEFCGCEVFFPVALTPEDDADGEYEWRHFTGWKIIDKEAGELGVIDYVDDSTPNVLFQIGELMIPAVEEFIGSVDSKKRTMYMVLPEGLLEL